MSDFPMTTITNNIVTKEKNLKIKHIKGQEEDVKG